MQQLIGRWRRECARGVAIAVRTAQSAGARLRPGHPAQTLQGETLQGEALQAETLRSMPPQPLPSQPLAPQFHSTPAPPISAGHWAVAGFVCGALFWHFIGFWGFVSEVVFSSRTPTEDRQIAQAGVYCIELVLDRATGRVHDQPCALEAAQLDESSMSAKVDFLADRPRLARRTRTGRGTRLTSGER